MSRRSSMLGIGTGSIKRGTILSPSKDEDTIIKMKDALSGKTASLHEMKVYN